VGSLEEHFLPIRIELADREASAARQTARRIGKPSRKARWVVKGQEMSRGAVLTGAGLGSTSALSIVLPEHC
jgi:hypothetical protein